MGRRDDLPLVYRERLSRAAVATGRRRIACSFVNGRNLRSGVRSGACPGPERGAAFAPTAHVTLDVHFDFSRIHGHGKGQSPLYRR